MARKLRVEYPGALYHVTARGNDRQRIFRTDADRRHLLALLAEGQERYEVRVFAYVLMQTHYHLVVQTEHPNLHSFMHYLNTAYTVWSNKRNARTGHLFEGPYKAIVMEEEGYLLTVTGYVHLNPVRVRGWREKAVAERLERVMEYPWSSVQSYVKNMPSAEEMPRVDCGRVWGELGASTAKEGRRQYRKYVRGWLVKEEEERRKPPEKRDEAVFNPLGEVRMGCVLGGDRFRDFVQDLLGPDRVLSEEIVAAKQWRRAAPLDALLGAVADVLNAEPSELRRRRRNHVRRDAAMYLCREAGERTLKEIGTMFGVKTAAAGHAVSRVKRRRNQDRKFAAGLEEQRRSLISKLET